VIEREDQYRFQVEPVVVRTGRSHLWLSCDRCRWFAAFGDPISLADLNDRASEHTEVCR
jgi:hypothetical protein